MPVNPTGGEFQVNTFTTGEQTTASLQQGGDQQRRPTRAIAMDPNGGFVVVWSSQGQDTPASPIGWGVYGQRYDATGNRIGGEFLINSTTTGSQLSPAIAMDSTGNFVVTWTSPGDGDLTGIYARRYNSSGVAQGSEVLVNPDYIFDAQQNSSIAMNATGEFVITWSSSGEDGDGWGVVAQQFNANGTRKGGPLAVNTVTPGDQQSSSVAIAPDGSFVVVWEAQDGGGWGIFARRYSADGTPQGGEIAINTVTARDQRNPSVAIDSSGNFVVTWTSDNGVMEGQEVYARRFNASGVAQGNDIRVNINTFGDQQFSTVTTIPPSTNLPGGGFAITWSSTSGENVGSGNGIYIRRYNAAGLPLEDEFQANTYTVGDQYFSSIASDQNGNLAAVWTSQDQAGDQAGGIFGQRFTASATLNVAPTDLLLAPTVINENKGDNALVGTFVTTDANAGDTFTYTLVDGEGALDNAAFTISGSQLLIKASPNFEAKGVYSIRIRSTDQGGLFVEKAVTINVNDVNEISTDISINNSSIDENVPDSSIVGSFSTIDPDTNDSFSYELVPGVGSTDNAAFSISGNQLLINASPNFETKSSYSIRVKSTDQGGLTFEKVFTVQIRDVSEGPSDLAITPAAIDENKPAGSLIGTFSTVDPDTNDTFTYALVAGVGSTDNAAFTISGNQLLITGSPDFETKSSYSIRVRTTDSTGKTFEKVLTVAVNNLNELPTDILLAPDSIDENVPANSLIGNLSTSDPDVGNTFTYALVAGAGDTDNVAFTLSPTGELRIVASPDFEAKPTYSIRVKTTDQGGLSLEKILTVKINDLVEAPNNQNPTDLNLNPTSIAENSGNATVGTLTTVDANVGDTFTYTLVAGEGDTDNAAFTIVGNQLQILQSADFETKNAYSVRVRTRDQGGLSFEKTFTIAITDVNEVPTDITLNNLAVQENVPANTAIGAFSTTDPDTGNTFTYSLVAGTGSDDNAAFTIVGNQLLINASPNFEIKKTYSIRVQSTDQGGLTAEKILTINVTDINETPTDITLTPNTINENVAPGTSVGNLQAIDEDAGENHLYQLVTGAGDTDNGVFTLTPAGQLIINVSPNYEVKNAYSVRVKTTDKGGLTLEKIVTVNINDLPEDGSPTNLFISNSNVNENDVPNKLIGQLTTTDPDPDSTFTYTLVPDFGDNAAFTITGDQLFLTNPADFEAKPSYNIKVRTTDNTGRTLDKVLTVNVLNVNETPTALNLSNTVLNENVANPVVGLLTTADPDIGDTFTYTLAPGFDDNAAFTIVGNELRINTPPNFEAKSSYSIRIITQDAGGLSFTRDFTITINNVSEAPIDLNLSASSIDENKPINTVVGTLSTTDQDVGDTHTYSLVPGVGSTDNAVFEIVNNELRIKAIPDFETKPTYSIRVRSTDSTGLILDKVLTINVNNLPETAGTTTPQDLLLSQTTVDENKPADTIVGTFSTVDPDSGETFTYTLVDGVGSTDNAAFKIVNNQLQINAIPDFEAKPSYSIRVRTTDAGGLFFEKTFTINVNNLPENPGDTAPTNLLLSKSDIDENQPPNSLIGTFSTTDPDTGDTFTYSLVIGDGSEDNAAFTIVNNELRINNSPDFETKPSYQIRVRSTDVGGKFFERVLTINVNNLPELPGQTAPTDLALSKTTIDENQPANSLIGNFSTTDPDTGDTFTYSLVPGAGSTDNTAFTIFNNELRINGIPDFEAKPSYQIRVRSTDVGGKFFERVFTITVNNLPETPGSTAPQDLLLSATSLNENNAAGVAVGSFSTTDPDAGDTFTYTLVPGTGSTDNAAFTIVNNELRINGIADFEAKSTYSVRVRTTDSGGNFLEKVFTINVNNLPELPGETAPTDLALSKSDIDENQPPNSLIGNFSTTDPDAGDTFTYTLVPGTGSTDNAAFTIVNNELRINGIPDFEVKPSYQIRVRTTDVGGKFFEKVLTINVNNLPELPGQTAPTDLALSKSDIDENQPANSLIGNFSTTDPDTGDTFTYSLVPGTGSTDNAAFTIVNNELRINGIPDFEAKPSYQIRVRTTDSGGKFFEKVLTINVNNLPELPGQTAPTDLALSKSDIDENQPANSLIGNFSTTDPDAGDTFTYSLVPGTGSTDNAAFTIVNNELRINGIPDFEVKPSYQIRVRTTDVGGKFFEKVLTINVNNLPELPGQTAPTDLALSKSDIDENQPANSLIGNFSTTDPDTGDTFTYSLVPGTGSTDNAAFTIVNNELRINGIPDFEAKPSYQIRVRTTDSGGKFFEKVLTINVNNLPELPGQTAPTDLALSKSDINENQPPNSLIGNFSTTDPDAGDTFTYTLVPGTGSTDNAAFTIVNNELRINGIPDFEAKPSYQIRVRTTDVGGKFFEKILTINVNNLPELPGDTAPTDLLLSNAIVNENAPSNSVIGTLSTVDPDVGDTHTYTLVPGFSDNASFSIVGNELRINSSPDFEAKSTYSIQIRTTDIGGKSFTKTLTINVRDLNEPPIVSTSAGALSYQEGSGAAVIDPLVRVTDIDSANLTSATVALVGYVAGQDILGFINQGGISGSFDTATGILTLTGTASVAAYEAALRSVSYANTSSNPTTTARTIRFTASDGTNTSNIATRTIQIVATNTAPTVATSAGGLSYSENSGAIAIDPGVVINDVDSANLTGATIALDNYVVGQDVLSFTNQNGITANFDAAIGVLTLSGVASLSNYQAALRSVRYTNTSGNPTSSNRTAKFSVTDGAASSNVATRIIQILPTNTAPTLTTSAGLLTYTENGAAVAIDVGVAVTDPDSATLSGAIVTISSNYVPGQDVLGFINQGGIAGSFNAATGQLTLTGIASVADYQAALRSITYANLSDNPGTVNRTLRFTVSDGAATSNPANRTLQIIPVNDAPIAVTSTKTVNFPRAAGAVTLDANLGLSDIDSTTLAGATIALEGYVPSEDGLLFNDQNGITGSFNALTGVLTLTGSATVANYQTALRSIIYTNTSSNSVISPRNVEITVTDGAATSNPDTARLKIQFDKSDTIPVLDLNGTGAGRDFSNTFVIAGAPVTVTDSSVRLSDSDSATMVSARVTISNMLDGENEALLVDTNGTNIRAAYNSRSGSLSLTGAGSAEDYLNVLRSIRYQNRSLNPDRTTRILLFSVNDGVNSSEPAQTAIQITQINLNDPASTAGKSLFTTPATDFITAPNSNDTLSSNFSNLQQNDRVDGGIGFDTFILTNGGGEAFIDVRNPINQVQGIFSAKTTLTNFEFFDFSGFSGNVTSLGSDTLNDRIAAGRGNDMLMGGGGSDRLIGNEGNDRLDGGNGNDVLIGGLGDDIYVVNSANDQITEGLESGFDVVYAAVNWVLGNELEDLTLTAAAVSGTGNALKNKIVGNEINNLLNGSGGNDLLIGNGGKDTILGGMGGDTIYGGQGNDKLNGGKGNDKLYGDAGKDTLTGGKGKDQFCLVNAQKSSLDKITDFRAIDDTICIARKGFSRSLKRGRISDRQFVLGSKAIDRDDRFIYNRATGALFYDADGAGGAGQIQIVQLTARTSLTRSDIFVIR